MEGKLMVTENTPYVNKKYIVEDLEFDPKFKNEKEIEDLNFKRDNAYGVWDSEAEMRMRESTTFIIRFKTIWESILHLFHSVRINLTP